MEAASPELPGEEALRRENEELRSRARELMETIDAIRRGEVDAIVVPEGDRYLVYALEGVDTPYRALVENIQEGALTLSPEGMILYCNAAYAALRCLAPSAIPGTQFRDHVTPGDRTEFDALFSASLAGPRRGEVRLCSGAAPVPVLVSMTPVMTKGETTISVVVADRSQDYDRLRLLARMLDSVVDAVTAAAPDGTIIYWNRAAERLYGWTAAEMIGRSMTDATELGVTAEEAARVFVELSAGRSWSGEHMGRHRDGHTFPVLATRAPVFDEDGTLIAVIGTSHDISERKEAEEALRENEARQAFLLGLSDALRPLGDPVEIQAVAARILAGYLGVDRVAYFEVAGDEYVVERDCACAVPSVIGRYPVDSFGSRLLEVYRSGATAVCGDVEADTGISPEEKATFAAVQIRAYIGVPLVKAGVFVAGLAVHMQTPRDWTPAEISLVEETAERTWAAAERARAEAALREYAANLQRSNDDLQRFAYVASHDLQEPLRSVISFSQLLERRYKGELGEDADEYIGFIVEGGQRMQGLILDLLAFSRVNTTRQQIARTNAEEVLAEAVRSLDLSLREAEATLTHDPLPVVMADPIQLAQVFSNLISNAVKFRRADVPLGIHVGARRLDGFWEISVADNGIGIEREYFDRIFVIFQRLHTKETYPGTGIGLAIVKRIIDRHGGRIRVASTPGEGTTFYFTLPAA